MARGRKRKISTKTLDEKIELQKNVLEKAKVKYEAEKERTITRIPLMVRDTPSFVMRSGRSTGRKLL